ncbi:MAG: hypothetical protein PS018_25965 [bacterium]|nr:hypothetical protein [bacterium]
MSILVFGLGAAALLRAAHEEFATLPSRRGPPERMFARQNDILPTLALLRIEPDAGKPPETAPPIAADIQAPAERAEAGSAEPEKPAALKTEEPQQLGEAARLERSTFEVIAETPAPPAQVEAPTTIADVKLAALTEVAHPEAPAAPSPAAAEAVAPATATLAPEGNPAATKIATLGGPAVMIEETTSARTTDAKPDRSIVRKRAAQRAREKRRIARRARLAREAALAAQQAQQQQANPFEQTTVARRTR